MVQDKDRTKAELISELAALRQRVRDLEAAEGERAGAEEALRQRTHDLGERVKELTCLYGIAALLTRPDISLEQILQGTVDLIPQAWQYPEVTCARVVLGGQEFRTGNFREAAWKQTCAIGVKDAGIGTVEVYYKEWKPEADEGPFLKEEALLIQAIANHLGEVVERKRAEEKIRVLAKFPSENPNPVLRVAGDGTIAYANETSRDLLDVWGVELGALLPVYWREIAQESLSSGVSRTVQTECGERTLSLTFAPVAEEGYANAYGLDITARVRAEESLREERNLLRTLIDTIPDYICVKDVQARMVLNNAADIRVLRATTQEEVVGKTDFDLFPEEFAAQYNADDQAVIRSGQPIAKEEFLIDETGETRCVSVIKVPLKNSQGEIVGLVGVSRDITARKQAEEALQAAKDYAQNIIDSSLDMIVCVDENRKIVEFNPAAEQTFGYNKADIIGQPVDRLYASPAESLRVHELILRGGGWSGEVLNTRKNGDVFPSYLSASVMRDREDRSIGVVGISRDITERKQAEAVIRQSQRELSLRNRIAGVFLTISDNEMYAEVLQAILEATDSEHGVFGYLDEKGDLVVPTMTQTVWDQCQVADKTSLFPRESWGDSTWARAIGERSTIFSNEPSTNVPEGHIAMRRHVSSPIIHRGEVVGLILVANKEADYDDEDLQLLEIVADAIAPVLDARLKRERQEETLRRHAARLEVRHEIDQAILAAQSTEDIIEATQSHMRKLLPGGGAIVALLDFDAGEARLIASPATTEIRPGHFRRGMQPPIEGTDDVIEDLRSGQVHLIQDLLSISDPSPLHQDLRAAGLRTYAAIPLIAQGELLGSLDLVAEEPAAFSEEHIAIAREVANSLAVAIQGARLLDETQRQAVELESLNATLEERVRQRTFELEVLYELSNQLGYTLDYDQLLRLMMKHLRSAIPYDVSAALLGSGDGTQCLISSTRPLHPAVTEDIVARQVEMMGKLTGQSLKSEDVTRRLLPREAGDELLAPIEELRSVFQVPIVAGKETAGLLLVAAEEEEHFSEDEVRLLYTVADQAAGSVQRLRSLLASEQQRLENLVEHIPEGVLLLDAERRIVVTNPVARNYLSVLAPGLGRNDVLTELAGRPIEQLLEPPSSGTNFHELATEEPAQRLFETESRWMEAGPEAGGCVLLIREVTTEREAQERIRQQERLVAVGQLAAGIAHDFNNILTGIIGFSELVRSEPNLPDGARTDLARVIKQGRRASGLVRQILDFSRKSVIRRQRLDLTPFFKEAVRFLERTIPESILIVLDIEPIEHVIHADATQVHQVLTNLAVNARDAMPEGGELTLGLSRLSLKPGEPPPLPELPAGEWVVISVSDSGAGVPPEVLPHIFEPFYTTKSPGRGTGLGLSQVYGIVKQHEGHIDVESRVGEGTTFTIYLASLLAGKGAAEEGTLPPPPRGSGEMVLLVEDEQDVRDACERLLGHLGYQVLTAGDGQQALAVYAEHQDEIALILTDAVMPQMGGVALVRALRAENPGIRVVITSGYPLGEDAEEFLAEGTVAWLQKPWDLAQLAQVVRGVLG